ncbi:MAG: tetratricopeptide repeat protein [Candidatus Melainabacteria bacterium]|nr:tetratricopeptide repeat protein [Candidatus Melainabacteria bacterium]
MNSLPQAISWKQLIQKAEVCLEDGNYDESEQLYREALSAVSEEYGPNHPHASNILVKLAGCYEEQGRTSDSHDIFRLVHQMVTTFNPTLVTT